MSEVVKKDKNAWYRQHKDEPEVREAFRASARKYYYKNRDEEKIRCLARYYAKKGVPMPEVRRTYNRKQKPPAEEGPKIDSASGLKLNSPFSLENAQTS